MRTQHAWVHEVQQSKNQTDFRGQLGSKLEQANKAYKAAAEVLVADGVNQVESALRSKLGQVQMQSQALQDVLAAVDTEITKLARTQQHINSLQAHLQDKLAVNRERQQVRRARPARETVCDDVNRSLSRQEALLGSLVQKLQRGTGLVSVDSSKLQEGKQKLTATLKDKLTTIRLDEAVLQMTAPAGDRGSGALLTNRVPTNNLLASLLSTSASPGHGKEATGHDARDMVRQATIGAARAACGSGLYPSKWQKHCDNTLAEAGNVVVDASRLRKAIKQMLQEMLSASQAADRQVDAALSAKMGAAGGLREQLAARLEHVHAEIWVATQHKEDLEATLQAEQVPLQHLQARFALRATRPAAELVEDDVQAALAAEAAQLKDVSTQLHARVGAAAQQIAHLNSVSAALLQHIADKDTALSLEEKVALMDGRKLAAVPPSPTVLSVSSSVASGYSGLGDSASQISAAASCASTAATNSGNKRPASCTGSATSSAMMRIAALEKELAAAKSESAQLRARVQGGGSGGGSQVSNEA